MNMFKKENKKSINNMKILDVSSIILSNLMKFLLVFLFIAIYVDELKSLFESGFLLFFMLYFPYIFVSFIQTRYIGKL